MNEHMVTMDPPDHTRARSVLSRLLTPSRLKQNEEFMWRLADRQLDEFLSTGECEFIAEYSKPFATLVIADLLGVPEEDHKEFRSVLGADRPGARVGALDHESVGINPLEWLDDKFCSYIEERRREPREDVLTSLATAKYPDGSTPEVIEVVRSATFLFAAGQETTAKLLSAALQVIGDRPDIQQQLRDDRSLIPGFIEESLRMDSPVKSDWRLARRATTVGGVDIAAGTVVMVLPGAANRDPRRFENPHEFDLHRKNVREHMAFARGVHSCPGGPLARVEGRVSIERILDRMPHIEINEANHGPADRSPLHLRADVHPARAQRTAPHLHDRRCGRAGGLETTREIYAVYAPSCQTRRCGYVSARIQLIMPSWAKQIRNRPSGDCAT